MAVKTVKIAELVVHKLLQATGRGPETQEGQSHVEDLRLAIRKKAKIPRPKVADIEGVGLCPWDGHHTIDAYEKEGHKEVECDVSKMTLEEARMKAACEANQGHTALKRSRQTKEWAVKTALEINPRWSNGRLANETGTSDNLVERVRKDNPQLNGEGPRVGADGKVRNKPTKRADRKAKDTPDAGKLFDFKGFEERINWLARGIDTLAELCDDKGNRKKALAGLNGAKIVVEKWRKKLQKKLEDAAKIAEEEAAAAEAAKKADAEKGEEVSA